MFNQKNGVDENMFNSLKHNDSFSLINQNKNIQRIDYLLDWSHNPVANKALETQNPYANNKPHLIIQTYERREDNNKQKIQ